MSSKVTLDPSVSIHSLGDEEVVLCVPETGQLFRLSPSAGLICRGLQAGLSLAEIVEGLSEAFARSSDQISRDVEILIEQLRSAGAVAGSSRAGPSTPVQTARSPLAAPRRSPASSLTRSSRSEHAYCLGDYPFRLRTRSAAVGRIAHQLFGHLEAPDGGSTGAVLEIVEDGGEWLLVGDGIVLEECAGIEEIAPRLHAHTLMAAYRASDCVAAVHAAAVTRGGRCILMPGVSGSGKTTLTAALLAHGFGYCTEDMALLEGQRAHIRTMPTCLGLKRGSWVVLADLYPALERLPVHLRADGQEVRYLPPPPWSREAGLMRGYPVCSIVFPSYSPGLPFALTPVSAGEGLVRLTNAGYDLPKHLDPGSLDLLIGWMSDLPCFELSYPNLDAAARSISGLLS